MTRHLVLVLGDQLGWDSPALAGFDPAQDRLLLIEAESEANEVWNHQARIALFLSGMRHFANAAHGRSWPFVYMKLDDAALPGDFAGRLSHALNTLKPQQLVVLEAGAWRMERLIEDAAAQASVPLRWVTDTHFMCSRAEFAKWAADKKELRMEFFYRQMRQRHDVLMEGPPDKPSPVSGQWNFDADNRKGFGAKGPGTVPPPARFSPDRVTQDVIALVRERFASHPGTLDDFAWPVTREDALAALQHFIDQRLDNFGPWQDAMWTTLPFGWHALVASSLNLHLLNPREVVTAAEQAYHQRGLPLASVEGFIRQVLGWREFIRGVYWLDMPHLAEANHYGHTRDLPKWYWTGQTGMACMQATIGQSLQHGYAHHIQRLMVTGQFAVLAGLSPQQVSAWYRAMYVDAVEWVEMPNTLGMALHANGGRFTSKPYVASGQYIARMSNYCKGCRYQPEQRTGPNACPMTTLYWDFLIRHEQDFAKNPRTALMVKHVGRMSEEDKAQIRAQANATREGLDGV
ncbi:cryptochrome/photolyase family protein [Limnohabitans sp. T6-20]|uniref:cryptochrome/photolyase family protein n=1 Tax=Limnohabitans sp. T6-20 TaxID=1100725 RepID=UPI000D38126E|nr:cryptochrome/photolyase family protein [Limnohabitans sp. T6-20]PUE12552.1 cryptochrome/photolyase family protein [Limnohabitans sp. T6-20]